MYSANNLAFFNQNKHFQLVCSECDFKKLVGKLILLVLGLKNRCNAIFVIILIITFISTFKTIRGTPENTVT